MIFKKRNFILTALVLITFAILIYLLIPKERINPSLFSKKVTIKKPAINVLDKPDIFKGNLITKVYEAEKYSVVDLKPFAILIVGHNKIGFIFIKDGKEIKIKSKSKLIIKKNLDIYKEITKKEVIGNCKIGEEYKILKVIPKFCKIQIKDKEGWIYVGEPENAWVEELNKVIADANFQIEKMKEEKLSTELREVSEEQEEVEKISKKGHLILWNRLGSKEEIEHSEVGPNLKCIGNISFKPAMFGNGFFSENNENYLVISNFKTFDPNCFTIEMWIKPNFGYNGKNTTDGEHHRLWQWVKSIHTYLNFCVANFSDGVFLEFVINGKFYYDGFRTSSIKFNSGELHHIGIVYNRNGIPGSNDTVRYYFDGKLIHKSDSIAPLIDYKSSINNFYLLIFIADTIIGEFRPQHSWNGIIDNIKIWDFPKTDFSDRFNEDATEVEF